MRGVDATSPERIALNEALFREVNEAIQRGVWPGEESKTVRFRCECGRLDCNGAVELSLSDYQQVRENPRRFVLISGHELPQAEVVVERDSGHVVVEKVATAGAIAEATDPRS